MADSRSRNDSCSGPIGMFCPNAPTGPLHEEFCTSNSARADDRRAWFSQPGKSPLYSHPCRVQYPDPTRVPIRCPIRVPIRIPIRFPRHGH